jgi:hypothetical protein
MDLALSININILIFYFNFLILFILLKNNLKLLEFNTGNKSLIILLLNFHHFTFNKISISFLDDYIEHWIGTGGKAERADHAGQKIKQRMIKRGILKQ